MRKGHRTAALREVDVAGSETIADGHGQPTFPGATIERRGSLGQRRPQPSWDKRRRGMRGQGLEGPGVALSDEGESRGAGAAPWLTLEG